MLRGEESSSDSGNTTHRGTCSRGLEIAAVMGGGREGRRRSGQGRRGLTAGQQTFLSFLLGLGLFLRRSHEKQHTAAEKVVSPYQAASSRACACQHRIRPTSFLNRIASTQAGRTFWHVFRRCRVSSPCKRGSTMFAGPPPTASSAALAGQAPTPMRRPPPPGPAGSATLWALPPACAPWHWPPVAEAS